MAEPERDVETQEADNAGPATRDERARFLGYGPELDTRQAEELSEEYQAAWLAALGLPVDEIAVRMEVSRATVYRLLKSAEKDHGLLDTRPRVAVPVGDGAELLWQRVERTELGRRVRTRLEQRYASDIAPREVLVAPTASLAKTEPVERREIQVVRRVARVGARRLMRGLLQEERPVRICGINWGFHCWRLAHSLPAELFARLSLERARALRFFPLVGSIGVLDADREHYIAETSANSNAERCVENLARYGLEPGIHGDDSDSPIPPPIQLTQPCVIPFPVDNADHAAYLEQVWRYIASDVSVQEIFGQAWALARLSGEVPEHESDSGPLLHRADTLITGLSTVDDSRAVRIGAIAEELAAQAGAAGAVGEMSAHYFGYGPETPTSREALCPVNRWVVAPTICDYRQCTVRARQTGRGLGTVLVASFGRKAAAVDAAISHGAVNVLVCDEELAEALLEL
ncbi:MAG: helix-turn-helix domain-containing protein [Armatimonadota bacterium]